MNTVLRLSPAVVGFALASGLAFGSGPPPSVLNPTTYTSRSKTFQLLVDPTDIYGRGPGDHRLTKDGRIVWTNRFDFTLWDAVVTDAGLVGGFAYTEGDRGFRNFPPRRFADDAGGKDEGDLVVAVFAPDGTTLIRDVHKRGGWPRPLGAAPSPTADGVLFDGAGDRFIIRRHSDEWWVYDCRTGQRLPNVKPRTTFGGWKGSAWQTGARSLPGTELILISWEDPIESPSDAPPIDAVFTLVDRAAKPMWSLRLGNDYGFTQDLKERCAISKLIEREGAILGVEADGRFNIRCVKDHACVSFQASKQPDGKWQVTKLCQVPSPQHKEPKAESSPVIRVDRLEDIRLDTGGALLERSSGTIQSFEFDSLGRIYLLRSDMRRSVVVARASPEADGSKEEVLPIEQVPQSFDLLCSAHLGDSRFVVSILDRKGASEYSLINFDSRRVQKLNLIGVHVTERITGLQDGRFIAVTERREQGYSLQGLCCFNFGGELCWKGWPEDLLSPVDLVGYGKDGVAILDGTRNAIYILDGTGGLVRKINLEEKWDREPNYLTDIALDENGGFIVYAFGATNTLVRVTADGSIRSQGVPRFADGRPFRVVGGVKRAPDGRLWTCDGTAMLRLSESNVVDLVLGEKANPDVLSAPRRLTVGPDGRIYIGDDRTDSVHVFEPSGKRAGCCRFQPGELNDTSTIDNIAVDMNGNVYVHLDDLSLEPVRYSRFDRKFTRVGWTNIKTDDLRQQWHFQPRDDRCWVLGYHAVFLVERTHDIVRTISRRADRRWLEFPVGAAVASDGSIAVETLSQKQEHAINIFSPSGDAVSTFPLPADYSWQIAYDGRRIYTVAETFLSAFQTNGILVGRFELPAPAAEDDWDGPHMGSNGSELWFLDKKHLKIVRFAPR